jgi:hypothetical protein
VDRITITIVIMIAITKVQAGTGRLHTTPALSVADIATALRAGDRDRSFARAVELSDMRILYE